MGSIPTASTNSFPLRGEFVSLIDGGRFAPTYAEVISSTPQAILDRAGA